MPLLRKKLRLKFILVLIGVASLPFFFSMTGIITNLQGVQQRNAIEREKQTILVATREISEFIGLQFAELDALEALYPTFRNRPDFQEMFLERVLFSHDSFIEIAIVDRNGRETTRINRIVTVNPEDLADRSKSPEFLGLKEKGRFIGNIFWEHDRPTFVIGRAIFDAEGNFFGGIFGQVDARVMQDVVSKLSVTKEGGRAYVVDKKGSIVAHPDISDILAQKNFSSIPVVQALIQGSEDLPTDPYHNELGEEVIGAGAPISIFFGYRPRGELETNWFAVAELPTLVAFAAVREVTLFAFIVLIGVLALAVAAAVLLARRIVSPIEKLQKGAEQIGLGNLEFAVQIDTNDELEDLSDEFNRMRIRIKEVREREKLLSQVKSDFITVAAHQLRTPLSELKWALQALIDGDAGALMPDQKKLLEGGYKTNERIIDIVGDFLDVSSIEEGKFGYRLKEENIAEIVKDTVRRFTLYAQKYAVTVTAHEPNEALPPLTIDREKIDIALSNIIDNAIQYNHRGGAVDIYMARENDFVKITVKDTGAGIPKEDIDRLFSKFFRAKNAMSLQPEGSGLGLFIAHNIIKKHGGNIRVASEESKGAEFIVTLPIDARMIPKEEKLTDGNTNTASDVLLPPV